MQTNRTRLLAKPIATFDRLFTLLIIRDHFKGFKWKQINLLLNFTFEAILRIYSRINLWNLLKNQSLESISLGSIVEIFLPIERQRPIDSI